MGMCACTHKLGTRGQEHSHGLLKFSMQSRELRCEIGRGLQDQVVQPLELQAELESLQQHILYGGHVGEQ